MVLQQEVVVHLGGQAVGPHPHPVGIGRAGVVFSWHALQCSFHVWNKLRVGFSQDACAESFPFVANVFTQYLDSPFVVAVVARSQHVGMRILPTVASSDMEIISCMHRLLAPFCQEGAEMGFVWRLVLAESCVAIDAIRAVFDCQRGYVFVKAPDFCNEAFAESVPFL